jgi:hypothetical protein
LRRRYCIIFFCKNRKNIKSKNKGLIGNAMETYRTS